MIWKKVVSPSSPALASVAVQVLSNSVDWAALRAEGWDPAAAVGEFAQWREGSIWELRRVLVSGLVLQPQYGAKGEPLQFSLKAHPFTDRSALPEATALVPQIASLDAPGGTSV